MHLAKSGFSSQMKLLTSYKFSVYCDVSATESVSLQSDNPLQKLTDDKTNKIKEKGSEINLSINRQ
jgi:hypothetical protein